MLTKSTRADTLKQQERTDSNLSPSHKSSHRACFHDLERLLAVWEEQCAALNIAIVTGATIRHKAEKIRRELMLDLSVSDPKKLAGISFCPGRLQRFQVRYGVRTRCAHDETVLARAEVVEKVQEELRSVTIGLARRGICNMDETAYYYTFFSSSVPFSK